MVKTFPQFLSCLFSFQHPLIAAFVCIMSRCFFSNVKRYQFQAFHLSHCFTNRSLLILCCALSSDPSAFENGYVSVSMVLELQLLKDVTGLSAIHHNVNIWILFSTSTWSLTYKSDSTVNPAALPLFDSPPPSSSPSPSDSDNSKLPNERRLPSSDSAPAKCVDPFSGAPMPSAPSDAIPLVPYGGYTPVGAPYAYSEPGVPALAPAPSHGSGADASYNNQPAPQPESGDDGSMAHTTMYNQCTYTIITSTGNIEGAGTQADVNVEFFDKYGDSVLFVGLKSQNRNFNRGATDTFTVVGNCVQNICRMHLSHDDSGPHPGWFVNTVTVSLLYQTQVFNVFEWLAKDEPPYSLSRTVSSCPAWDETCSFHATLPETMDRTTLCRITN